MIARCCAIALLLAATGPAAAQELAVREQFAYALPIELARGEPLQRVELPLAVYRDALDGALRDLRVLNGRGEVVPFALERPPTVIARPVSDLVLLMFPLRGDPVAATSALRLSIDAGAASVELQGGPPSEAPLTAYLLDTRTVVEPLERLTFQLPADAPDFSVSAMLEASEDLADWRVVVARVPLARLRNGTQWLEQLGVTVPPTRARFWRLSAPAGDSLPAMSAAFAQRTVAVDAVDRQVIAVAGQAATSGEYWFDLGAHVPVDRLALDLPDVNTVAQVDYFARRTPAEPWRHVARGTVQRMQTSEGERRSEPLAVAMEPSRYWRAVVDPRGGGLGAGVPGLRAGWLPHQVLFLARGEEPFELVYGRFGAENAAVSPDELSSGAIDLRRDVLTRAPARTGEPRLAGGIERLEAPPPPPGSWRLGMLWVALGAGVVTLAALAWRLARQMRVGS